MSTLIDRIKRLVFKEYVLYYRSESPMFPNNIKGTIGVYKETKGNFKAIRHIPIHTNKLREFESFHNQYLKSNKGLTKKNLDKVINYIEINFTNECK